MKVQIDLSPGSSGRIRGMGEPTRTRTMACAGVLTLYPEAWAQLHATLLGGMVANEGGPGPMEDLEIIQGKPR